LPALWGERVLWVCWVRGSAGVLPKRSQDEAFGDAKAYDGVFFFLLAPAPPRLELWFLSTAPSLVFK